MQEEKRKIITQWMFPTIALIAVIAGMLFNFTAKSSEMAATSVEKDMIVISERYGSELNSDLTFMAKTSAAVSVALAQINGKSAQALEALCNYSPAYMAVHCDSRGQGITQTGDEVDLSKEEYFSQLLASGENTYIYISDDKITGQKAVVHAINISNGNGDLLLTYYPISNLGKCIRKDDFDADVFFALVDIEGNILARTEYKSEFFSGENIYETLGDVHSDSIRKMSVRLKNGVSGSMEAIIGSEARTLVYTPFNLNQWTVIVGVNQYYVDRQEEKEWDFTRRTLFQLVVVVCIFLILLVLINVISKMRSTENTKHLQEKADTDLLTGLNNKLATERKIKEYMASHPNEQSMMFVLDIDNFKKINDTMGHAFGDEVLRSLGLQITAMFRITDIVGRTGGDEFIIFLKSIKEETLLRKEAEKVARFFHDFKTGEYVKYSATASIGVAVFPKDGKDFEALYKAADQALYMAKKRGKNQLAFYHDELEAVIIDK